jgi:hypothetical protein
MKKLVLIGLVIVLMIIRPDIAQAAVAWVEARHPPAPPAAPAASPPPAPPASVTEQQVFFRSGTGYCEDGCITLQEWEVLVTDEQIFVALTIAYHYNPDWRPLAQAAVRHQTRVVWEDMDENVLGYYSSRENIIAINTRLKEEGWAILAATLVHELSHSAFTAQGTYGDTPADCISEEMAAKRWEAAGFERMRQGNEDTELGLYMNKLVVLWRMKQLQPHILLMDGYQEQCLGAELPDY